MTTVDLQIPLLFDISAGAVVFGEKVEDVDLFDAHLNFTVTGSSGDNLVTQFKNIMYADASENDVSGVNFYAKTATLSDDLGSAIEVACLGSDATLIQPAAANDAAAIGAKDTSAHNARYMTPGIPLPDYSQTTEGPLGATNADQAYYTAGLVDADGTSFGRILIRLMATHLMGHPFAQSFIANEAQIINDISNTSLGTQLEDRLLKNDSDMFAAGGSNSMVQATEDGTSGDGEKSYKAQKSAGIRNQILQSIYEALLGTAPARFDLSGTDATGVGADVSGNDLLGGTDGDAGNLDPGECRPRVLPFAAGDTISFYFRPRVGLTMDTDVSGGGAEFGNQDLSGVGLGGSASSAVTIESIFFNPRHRWISHKAGATLNNVGTTAPLAAANHTDTYDDSANSGSAVALAMTGTDLVKGTTFANGETIGTMFDGHIWKIKVVMT